MIKMNKYTGASHWDWLSPDVLSVRPPSYTFIIDRRTNKNELDDLSSGLKSNCYLGLKRTSISNDLTVRLTIVSDKQ